MSENYNPQPSPIDEALVLLDRAQRAAVSSLAQNTEISLSLLGEVLGDLLDEDLVEMGSAVDRMLQGTYFEDLPLSAENRLLLQNVGLLYYIWVDRLEEEQDEKKEEGQDEG